MEEFKPKLADRTGECKYCKQLMAIKVPERYSQDLVDEEVSKFCKCPEAVEEQKIISMIACTESQLRKFFEDKGMELFEDVLLAVVEPMARNAMEKISMKAGKYTIAMRRKSSSIEISIKLVEEEKVEA